MTTREDIVFAWSKRHGLDLCSSDLRCAFDDAATTFSNTAPQVRTLIERWRKDAAQYQKQVDEARQKGTPHDQMLSAVTFLRQCAKELEEALTK